MKWWRTSTEFAGCYRRDILETTQLLVHRRYTEELNYDLQSDYTRNLTVSKMGGGILRLTGISVVLAGQSRGYVAVYVGHTACQSRLISRFQIPVSTQYMYCLSSSRSEKIHLDEQAH